VVVLGGGVVVLGGGALAVGTALPVLEDEPPPHAASSESNATGKAGNNFLLNMTRPV